MSEGKAALGSDAVLWLVEGLRRLDDVPAKERDALVNLLWNADLVTLHFNPEFPSSLAYRATCGKTSL
jgi:hypothetical protein